MNRFSRLSLFSAATLLFAFGFGCGRSILGVPDGCDGAGCIVVDGPGRPDGVVPFDGPFPDDLIIVTDVPRLDVVRDTRVPRCGDSVLDPGESCDDGNNANGDGCSGMCRWEARCGDGRMDPGEVCDDGNNRSGDGCRSDCRSNERCGNGIIDVSVGELCDGTPNCAADCRSITSCGNNRIEAGEECDDGNTARWDGCASDCRNEQGVGLNALYFSDDDGRTGCDFSGDGRPDNAFARGLGLGAGLLNTAITNGISNGQLLIILAFMSLDDALGRNDSDLRVGWLRGADGDMDILNNGHPGNPQRVLRASLNMLNLPVANFQSTIVASLLSGGPEDLQLDLPGPMGMPFSFRLQRSRIGGPLMNDGMRISAIANGVLCGAIAARSLADVPNFFSFMGGGAGRSTMLEALVGGYRIMIPLFGSLNIGPVQPDIDLDGDGLERLEATAGDARTPPAITACIDGNGVRIPGRDCVRDPRIADGFTASFSLNGVWVRIVGLL